MAPKIGAKADAAGGGLSDKSEQQAASGIHARRKAAEAEGERGSAMKCNNSFNIASDTSKSVKKREAAAVGTKKASSVASKGRAQESPASEYDALEYVTPLPDVAANRPMSSLGTNLFAEDSRPGKKISMKLVAIKALGEAVVASMKADQIADAVMKLDKVRLDDECIEEIDNLEALGAVTHLQLQRNRLQCMCNLESLQHLQLLTLASNDIMDIQNLTCLRTLKAFDIGYNLLDEVPAHELPPSLLYLTTEGNPLRKMDAPGSWDQVYALPNLRQHDCQDIPDDDDEDDEEEGGEGSGRSRGGEEDGGDAAGHEGDSNGIGGEELLQMVTELGHRRLEAAAKVFEDSMAVLRDNRNRVVEIQRGELAKDIEQQNAMYQQALGEMQDMMARQDSFVRAQQERMGSKWEALRQAEDEEALSAGARDEVDAHGIARDAARPRLLPSACQEDAEACTAPPLMVAAAVGELAAGLAGGGEGISGGAAAGGSSREGSGGEQISVLKDFVDNLGPE